MSLARFLAPDSIALIGASPDRTKIRGALLHILRSNGFAGAIYPVNPSYREIDGLVCYPTAAAIGRAADLAVLAVPAPRVPAALEDCAAAGIAHALIISSGFAEAGGERSALQDEIRAISQRTGMRIAGPNAEGFHNELAGVSATFSPVVERRADNYIAKDGRRVGIVAQSGGMGFALYNRGRELGLPFSTVISTGNEVDLGAADFFRHLVEDPDTGIVLLFLESIRDPQGFMAAAARAVELGKPVIAAKVGASPAGERAAASHTASMAGWDAAYGAAFKRFGIITAADPDEAVGIAAALSTCPRAAGRRAAIVTVSGGAGAWCADMLTGARLELPELSPALQKAIAAEIPSYGSTRNPVDVTAQAVHTGSLGRVIARLGQSDEIDLIAIVLSLSSTTRIALGTEALAALRAGSAKPLLFYSYTMPSDFAKRALAAAGAIVQPGLYELGRAARALTLPIPIPVAPPPETPYAPMLRAMPAGRHGTLAEHEAKQILAGSGIALPPEILVRDETELAAAAAEIGFPLVVKIQSPDLPHKTEIGGVALDLHDLAAARAARCAMLARAEQLDPAPRIDGVLVQAMAPPGLEMIVASVRDPGFGPVMTIGAGGITTELYQDVAHRLAPLGEAEALAMLKELANWRLLNGFRSHEPADVAALVRLVVQVSGFAWAHRDRVVEVELNPVIVHAAGAGVTIVDALITLAAP
jgi:acetate---CoA ligase (ADP-forming)